MNDHFDYRRRAYFDIFKDIPKGQVNVSVIHPMKTAGDWHKHMNQKDYWFVADGRLYVGLVDERTKERKDVILRTGDLIEIVENTWHTYQALDFDPTTLIYYVTNKYDPSNPDEQRTPYTKEGVFKFP